jgi:hypothetical protein
MAIGPGEVCGGSWQVCGLVIGGLLAVRHRLLMFVSIWLEPCHDRYAQRRHGWVRAVANSSTSLIESFAGKALRC